MFIENTRGEEVVEEEEQDKKIIEPKLQAMSI